MNVNTNNQQLETLLEALLFYRGEPVRIHDLAKTLNADTVSVGEALIALQNSLSSRGIRLIIDEEYAGLATAPEAQTLIEAMRREELEGPLGKAGLETLAIIMYKGPLSKADIEYIRGVNCSSVLRSLAMRGLIEKNENPSDKRSFLYRGTSELLASLGLTSFSDAPDAEKIQEEIKRVLENKIVETTDKSNE